jgi:hypothetical protein
MTPIQGNRMDCCGHDLTRRRWILVRGVTRYKPSATADRRTEDSYDTACGTDEADARASTHRARAADPDRDRRGLNDHAGALCLAERPAHLLSLAAVENGHAGRSRPDSLARAGLYRSIRPPKRNPPYTRQRRRSRLPNAPFLCLSLHPTLLQPRMGVWRHRPHMDPRQSRGERI